jgi:hypothetical protein
MSKAVEHAYIARPAAFLVFSSSSERQYSFSFALLTIKDNSIMHATHMSHKHSHTLQQIFQHPASHNLKWHDVVALVEHSGSVQEEANGNLIFMLSGVTEVFHRPKSKDVADVEQVLDIRRFLESAGVDKEGTMTAPGHAPPQDSHDQGHENADQNRHTEQQIKTQEHEQNERNAFNGGDAQSHQQGNRQK